MNGYLFDSNIIIDLLANEITVRNFILKAHEENKPIYFSTVSVCEIYSGSDNGETETLDKLFTADKCIEVSLAISREAGLLRRSILRKKQKIKTPDAIIAATAKCHNLCLVTRDRDFKVFEDYFAVLIQ